MSTDSLKRSDTFDVVVVGSGGAGLAAALEAARAGARTIVIEKRAVLGGVTATAAGSIAAAGTALQRRRGIADTAQAHFEDLSRFVPPEDATDNLKLRRLLTEEGAATIDWLMDLGLTFHGPTLERPHRVPRMHNVLFDGRAFIDVLGRHCRAAGVQFVLNTEAARLVVDDGRVTGVEARDGRGARLFRATRAVVLATGDFTAAKDFRADFVPAGAEAIAASNPASTGDGHRMATAVGARVLNAGVFNGAQLRFPPAPRKPLAARLPSHPLITQLGRFAMERIPRRFVRPIVVAYMTRVLAPSLKLLGGSTLLVNVEGNRIETERGEEAIAVARQPRGSAFIIFDDIVAGAFSQWPNYISTAPGIGYAYLPDYQRFRPDIYHQASSLDGIGKLLGMPLDNLRGAAAAVKTRRPHAFKRAPIHALGPLPSWLLGTDGGLAVNENLAVLGPDDKPIAGLYAAGSTGQGGLLLPWHGHHLAWVFTSGRIAGRSAAGA